MKKYFYLVSLCCLFFTIENLYAQTEPASKNFWQEAWEGVPEYYQKWDYPDFQFPAELSTWKKDRIKVSETLQDLLGDIPPRPKQLKVKTISREKRNGYILEKFLIDNGIDSWIPGYDRVAEKARYDLFSL